MCLAEGLKESMKRLQVTYIDVFQCHDIEFRNLDQVSQPSNTISGAQYVHLPVDLFKPDPWRY